MNSIYLHFFVFTVELCSLSLSYMFCKKLRFHSELKSVYREVSRRIIVSGEKLYTKETSVYAAQCYSNNPSLNQPKAMAMSFPQTAAV